MRVAPARLVGYDAIGHHRIFTTSFAEVRMGPLGWPAILVIFIIILVAVLFVKANGKGRLL
jgi:hypothetical protein